MTVNIVWVEVYFSGVLLKNPVSVISESVNSDMEKSKGINEISSFGVTFKKMHEFLEVDANMVLRKILIMLFAFQIWKAK